MNSTSSSRCPRGLLLALLVAWAPVPAAFAQGLTLIEARNDSTPAYENVSQWTATRFESLLTVAPPVQEADSTSIQLRLSWAVAREDSLIAEPFLLPTTTLGWRMVLRVEDPFEQGYSLDVDSRSRGTLGAQAQDLALLYLNGHTPFAFAFYEEFDTQPTALPAAGLAAGWMSAGLIDADGRRLTLDRAGAAEVGSFRGTRSFLFVLEPVALQLALEPLFGATAWQQFGRRLSGADWRFADPEPGTDVLDLGQFFRVTATFNPSPIPEPATYWLMALGAGALLWRQRRAH
jgi:hypothetical protein